ncbi:hypothetical protein GCM10023149_12850 [Mucilaginibacter gynuensis]|uniref:Serine/threonine-protein kinase RsbW n=1 Tax=Mucilaginibacter gynuensis TaxID=1302236 RepID=A0ABP8G2L1_9SPHI
MQYLYSYKDFVFLNARPALTSSLRQALDHIKSILPGYPDLEEIQFKAKSIITELLTNGFKHAGTETVHIIVSVEDDTLIIKRTEYGNPFPLPWLNEPLNTKKCISYDVMHFLYAVNEPGNRVRFLVEDSAEDEPDINDITEHFGLLIITKCADEFIYHFDEATKENHFIVKVNL